MQSSRVISFGALFLCLISFQNCAVKTEDQKGNESLSSSSTPLPSVTTGASKAFNPTLADHEISSNMISCDVLSPDRARMIDPRTIQLLATTLDNGLTLHHHYSMLVSLGYKGMLGKNQGAAWLAQDPARARGMEQLTNQALASGLPQIFSSARAKGYEGVFTCGGATCFAEGGCDKLGRRFTIPSLSLEDHQIPVKFISCDVLSPAHSRYLSHELITLLATSLDDGLTLHHRYSLLAGLGITGFLGKGEGSAFLQANPAAASMMSSNLQRDISAGLPQIFSNAKAYGYQGVFACGGSACYSEGRCDSSGRLL